MTERIDDLNDRLQRLETSNRFMVFLLTFVFVACAATALIQVADAQQQTPDQNLRARSLVIEDAEGRPRMIFGSPISDRQQKGNTRTGMIINDADGVERFGLALNSAGSVVMGFDAPPGKGDDRNRERITIVAHGDGSAYIRFLDRRTRIPARLFLDEDDRVWLEFNEAQGAEIVRRQLGFTGDRTVRETR